MLIENLYILLALMMLSACSITSPAYTAYNLNKKFDGRPMTDFSKEYGYPEARFERAGAGVEYEWASTELKRFPNHAAPEAYYSNKNGLYEVVRSYYTSTVKEYCRLRVQTDKNEIIQKISVIVDSAGKWSNSRCSEIFD